MDWISRFFWRLLYYKLLAVKKSSNRMHHLFRQKDDGLYDIAQTVADDLEDEDGAEESSPAAQDAQPSSMPGGKKALAILEVERLRAAGGMKGKKIITCSGRKTPLIT